jgi:hypothetical protein
VLVWCVRHIYPFADAKTCDDFFVVTPYWPAGQGLISLGYSFAYEVSKVALSNPALAACNTTGTGASLEAGAR